MIADSTSASSGLTTIKPKPLVPAVAGDDLRDVRWQAVHDGIGDKDSSKVVWRVMQGAPLLLGYTRTR